MLKFPPYPETDQQVSPRPWSWMFLTATQVTALGLKPNPCCKSCLLSQQVPLRESCPLASLCQEYEEYYCGPQDCQSRCDGGNARNIYLRSFTPQYTLPCIYYSPFNNYHTKTLFLLNVYDKQHC